MHNQSLPAAAGRLQFTLATRPACEPIGMSTPEVPSWSAGVGRIGYAAKGTVYFVVGILAGMAAFGSGGRTTGSKGAIQEIGQQPFGQVLLVLLGIGLCCYAIWRFLAGAFDAEGKGSDAKGIAARGGFLVSALIHFGLAFAAFRTVTGNGGGDGEGDARGMTAKVLEMPFGPWLVILAGIAIGIVGLVQWNRAIKEKYRSKFNLDGKAAGQRQWIERISKMGLFARGLVFLLIAFFLFQAGWQADAGEVRGFGGALKFLAQQPYGPWLLGVTALGVICYGIYCAVVAIYGSLGSGRRP